MKWRSGPERRIASGIIIGLGLIALAVGILVFADATAIRDEAKRWNTERPVSSTTMASPSMTQDRTGKLATASTIFG
jgi:hypothetical protein